MSERPKSSSMLTYSKPSTSAMKNCGLASYATTSIPNALAMRVVCKPTRPVPITPSVLFLSSNPRTEAYEKRSFVCASIDSRSRLESARIRANVCSATVLSP